LLPHRVFRTGFIEEALQIAVQRAGFCKAAARQFVEKPFFGEIAEL